MMMIVSEHKTCTSSISNCLVPTEAVVHFLDTDTGYTVDEGVGSVRLVLLMKNADGGGSCTCNFPFRVAVLSLEGTASTYGHSFDHSLWFFEEVLCPLQHSILTTGTSVEQCSSSRVNGLKLSM